MIAVIVLVPLGCFAAFCLLWPVFAAEPAKVRPLTMDEQAAWGIYRIQDAAKVARMKSTRAQDTRAWDARYEAIRMGAWGEAV
jgi:hypothetical protein